MEQNIKKNNSKNPVNKFIRESNGFFLHIFIYLDIFMFSMPMCVVAHLCVRAK